MRDMTRRLWDKQNHHPGDRRRLFGAVAEATGASSVLYPGSYVDVAASFVFDEVTYVDLDSRTPKFFGDAGGVDEIIALNRRAAGEATWSFIHADYTTVVALPEERFDLLVSLYAGFISEHCTHHLRIGGHLLVNPSHGDAAMASIDPRYGLRAVVQSRDGDYSVSREALASFLVPKRNVTVTKNSLHESGRGVGYTKSAFAYLFERIR